MKRLAIALCLFLASCTSGTTPTLPNALSIIKTTCNFVADAGPILILLGQPGATVPGVVTAVCAAFNATQTQQAAVSGPIEFKVNGVTVTGKRGE